jgi:hypothetical protein
LYKTGKSGIMGPYTNPGIKKGERERERKEVHSVVGV